MLIKLEINFPMQTNTLRARNGLTFIAELIKHLEAKQK